MLDLVPTNEEVNAPSIASAAMLVGVSVGLWEGERTDRKVTKEVAVTKGASNRAGRYKKSLLPNCDELTAIKQMRNNIRKYHREHTLPWSNLGMRLLTTKQFFAYNEKMTEMQQEYYRLVNVFLSVYDLEIAKAQSQYTALGALFDIADYPSVDTLRNKFHFGIDYMPLPEAGDFRVDIGTETKKSLQSQYNNFFSKQLENALKDVWERLAEMLTNMSQRLDYAGGDKPTGFRDTLVTNVTDHLKLMDTCNITNDPTMTRVRSELAQLFQNVTPDTLRNNETQRLTVKKNVDEILNNLPTVEI